MSAIAEDEIRKKAHELWEAAGKPQGRDEEFWFEAERQLQEELVKHELRTPDTL